MVLAGALGKGAVLPRLLTTTSLPVPSVLLARAEGGELETGKPDAGPTSVESCESWAGAMKQAPEWGFWRVGAKAAMRPYKRRWRANAVLDGRAYSNGRRLSRTSRVEGNEGSYDGAWQGQKDRE